MPDGPWLGDACSLVEAFREGALSPLEALDASLDAIERSSLHAFSHLDPDGARARAASADASLPLGGVPVGIKELEKVAGWPDTEASLLFKDRVASHTSTFVERLIAAGAVPVGLTTASELGGLNVSVSKLNGVTYNPWGEGRTAGGSSGGSASAVAGGLVPLATGGDGGGSIRIPAGFNGLPGFKATYGRIPRGPHAGIYPLTPVLGCLARSVRDIARFFDVCNGFDPRDPYSLPQVGGWEAGLGSFELAGLKATVVPDLGVATVLPAVADRVEAFAQLLAAEAGVELVDVPVKAPALGLEWAMSNIAADVMKTMGHLWPGCKDDLTVELAFGIEVAHQVYDLSMATRVEQQRTVVNEHFADVFEQVDLVISATNPDVAFPAEVTISTRVGDQRVGPENNGLLTIPANIVGNPAISIPFGEVDGLPVGIQVMTRHHDDAVLLDVARRIEQAAPWPLVAPGAPR